MEIITCNACKVKLEQLMHGPIKPEYAVQSKFLREVCHRACKGYEQFGISMNKRPTSVIVSTIATK